MPGGFESSSIRWDREVPSISHYPADPTKSRRSCLVLAHGAGAGQQHPFMVTCARGLAERGIDVVTFDFPYVAQKRRVPDKAPVLEACFRETVAEARQRVGPDRRLFIGGKSLGGRMATHLAAEGLDDLRGLVLLGYPLHPPGKPEQPRVAHLPRITVPILIVQGDRDTFGTPDEVRPAFAFPGARTTLHVVEGGDHSLKVSRSAGVSQQDVYSRVLDAIAAWVHSV
jgi:predicted alpha/beta-hydrolase family hydrolase